MTIIITEELLARFGGDIALAMKHAGREHLREDDLEDMLTALTLRGWRVEKFVDYDRLGFSVPAWLWTDNYGHQFVAHGSRDELPPWPKEARDAFYSGRSVL